MENGKRRKEGEKMEQWKIERINELARKSKQVEGLTEQEKQEQKTLRAEYIEGFRRSMIAQLDNTVIEDESGNRRRLRRREKS